MKKFLKELMPYIIIVLVIVLIRTFIITPVRVDGDSMKKNLNDGDILLLYKLSDIKRNDIIVLKEKIDNEVIIKRVVGLPGEEVRISNGKVYINNKEYEDNYSYGEILDEIDTIKLQDDEYFVLGDNRLVSKDSRSFGAIKKDNIMGKTIFRLFPFNKIGTV